MNPDLLSATNALATGWRSHIDGQGPGPRDAPKRRGAAMAQQRPLAVSKDCREPPSLLAQSQMPDSEYLTVHEPKAPAFEAALNRPFREAKSDQLPLRHDPMLSFGESHDLPFPSDPLAPPCLACLTWTPHMGG